MNLSFLPGDLHLYKDEGGFFIVKMSDQQILSTRSRRSALSKFNSLRAELEKRFPTREPTAAEKAELLRKEMAIPCLDITAWADEKRRLQQAVRGPLVANQPGAPQQTKMNTVILSKWPTLHSTR